MKRLPFYDCVHCGEKHQETTKENRLPILPDKCSARYRQEESGGWRSCHAPFAIYGGPHRLGPSGLCQACWDRQFMAPSVGLFVSGDERKAAKDLARGLTAEELVKLLPKDLQDLHERTKGGG